MWKLTLTVLFFYIYVATAERNFEREFSQDDVIELPVGRFPDPECTYSVKRKDQHGSIVKGEVQVGDLLYHEWACTHGGKDTGLYCSMVHNCSVSDGKPGSRRIPILDEFGCSLFPNVLPHVEYPTDMIGGLYAHAFALDVDRAAVFFECNVKMLLKLNGVCRRPTCPSIESLRGPQGRHKRIVRH